MRSEPAVRRTAATGGAPYRVGVLHAVAALVFLVAGAAVAAGRAPALAAGAFTDRGVVAAVHLLTLGWIGTSLVGGLYHFLPAELGAPIPWPRLADVTFVAWTAGVAAFTGGLVAGRPSLYLPGAGILGAAVLLYAVNLAVGLSRAPRRGLSWWCVAGGLLALAGGWILGLLLAVSFHTGVLAGSRFTVLAVHLHLAAGGWVVLTLIGVGHRLLPLFLDSSGVDDRAGRAAAGLVGAGTAGLLLSGHLLPAEAVGPALGLQAAGGVAFLLQAGLHYRGRRARPDPGTRLSAAALALLGLAVAVGVAALLSEVPDPRLLTAYGVLLVPGGLGLLVAGHHYALVPFLAGGRRTRPADPAEGGGTPGGRLYDHRIAHGAGALLAVGVAAAALGSLMGSAGVCAGGTAAFGAGALVMAGQMYLVLRGGR